MNVPFNIDNIEGEIFNDMSNGDSWERSPANE